MKKVLTSGPCLNFRDDFRLKMAKLMSIYAMPEISQKKGIVFIDGLDCFQS